MSEGLGYVLIAVGVVSGLPLGQMIGIWLAERRVRWIADYVGTKRGPAAKAAAEEIVRCMDSTDWYAAAGGR